MSVRNRRPLGRAEIETLLSKPERRHVLSLLLENGSATVDQLAHRIVARTGDTTTDAVDEDARERVVVALVHNHLPRLADSDVVEYGPAAETVVPAANFAAVAPAVDRFERRAGDRRRTAGSRR